VNLMGDPKRSGVVCPTLLTSRGQLMLTLSGSRVADMFLSSQELQRLTGYARSSAQIRWLRRNGWRFIVNALGAPVVALAEFNRHMVGGKAAAATEEPNFDWDAINGTQTKAG
jgi:Domain of unknown function (DUF4224)